MAFDILPTVLGLAGIDDAMRRNIAGRLAENRPVRRRCRAWIWRRSSWAARRRCVNMTAATGKGVLFITDDEITAPLPFERDTHNVHSQKQFEVYNAMVRSVQTGADGKGPVPDLAPSSVRQPNHVRCVRTKTHKFARYFDPSGAETDQWEMYDLDADPNETANLMQVAANPPTAKDSTMQKTVDELNALLQSLERRYLS